MANLRPPNPRFGGPPPPFGGGPPPFGGPRFGFMPRGPPPMGFGGERLGFNFRASLPGQGASSFDGKKLRTKPLIRRTVDYSSSMTNYIKNRTWERDHRDRAAIQPDALYATHVVPPNSLNDKPMNSVCTKYVRNASNKIKCPIFCVVWTPEGRRLITGASSGEFTLWNGLTFSFETILQAHDTSVRAMVWNNTGQWMVTGDHGGFVKYWQHNMNNVKMYQAHKDAVRGLSFCPTDTKFATCSDDGTVRVWDFLRCNEERILRGHGADVKCVDWHPQKGLIASGSRDNQQPIILWDPRMGTKLSTLHAHKSTVMEVTWNRNGNWLLSASRDHLIKLFDIRNMKEEVQAFKGHKKEATTVAWNPVHESLFASGGSDGQIMYWLVGQDREVGCINEAHETMVWSLAWHPMGHILVSGSNDHSSKFWTRNRPGDGMRDRYNLNLLPQGVTDDMIEYDDLCTGVSIPGMGLEYMPNAHSEEKEKDKQATAGDTSIPGLDFSVGAVKDEPRLDEPRKTPFAKPVPKDFERAWKEGKQPESIATHAENDKAPKSGNRTLLESPIKSEKGAARGGGAVFRKPAMLPTPPHGPQSHYEETNHHHQPKEEEDFTLPGMGGPLPGPEHEPTLPPSRSRRFNDGPITSTYGPSDSGTPVGPPSGGLLGDRPGANQKPPHQQQRSWSAAGDSEGRQPWTQSRDRAGSGPPGKALLSTPNEFNRANDYMNSPSGPAHKRRSYDDPHNSSQEEVFYEGEGHESADNGHYDEFGVGAPPKRGRYHGSNGPDSLNQAHHAFGINRNHAFGHGRESSVESNEGSDSYYQRSSSSEWPRGGDRGGRGRGSLRGRGDHGGRGRGGENHWRGGSGERGRGGGERGRGGSDRGRGGSERGRGGSERGRGSGERGRGSGERGRGSGERGRGGSDRGRGFGDRGRGRGERGGRGGSSERGRGGYINHHAGAHHKRSYDEGPGGTNPEHNRENSDSYQNDSSRGGRGGYRGRFPRGGGRGGAPRGRGAPRGMARV